MQNSVTLLIPLSRLPSVNELYLPNLNNGQFYKNPEVKYLMDKLLTHLAYNYPLGLFKFLNKKALTTTYDFILNKGIYRRDTSNMIKMVEDAIFRYIGQNDNQVVCLRARKSYSPNNKSEYIVVTISTDIDIHTPYIENQAPLVVPLKYVPSINDMYAINPSAKVEYKKGYIHEAEYFVRRFIENNVDRSSIDFLATPESRKLSWVRCSYDFFINSGTGMIRDVSNMIKFTEDAIFRGLGMDDSRVIEFQARKYPIMSTKNEYISFNIEKLNINSKHDLQIF